MAQDPQDAPPPRAEYARTWRRYLRFFGPRAAADLDDELRFHIEMRVRDYMGRGMSENDARAATAQRLGDLSTARQTCVSISTRRQRRMTRAQLIDALVQDVKFAARTLKRQLGWTVVAVLTLALGIGANSAMFSVINHLLLHPIPYPNADRVVILFQEPTQGNSTGMSVIITPMGRQVSAWINNAKSFEAMEPYHTTDVTLERPGQAPSIAHTANIRPSFARFADERPIIGRMFTDAEARSGENVLLISEGMWRRQYGADPAVIGQTLTIDRKLMTIIGVMPGVFQLPRSSEGDMDLWLPLDLVRSDDDGMHTVARLRPGVSHAHAAAELDSISARDPQAAKTGLRFKAHLTGPDEFFSYKDSLWLLTAAVALVLLIACANVAHLLLARASTRQREMAIRAALGAGSSRLFRQLVTESLMLSLAGCIGGLAIGWAGLRALINTRPENLADLAAAKMDGTTVVVTVVLSVVTGIVFGVIGAVQASRYSTNDALKTSAPGASADPTRGRTRALLAISEMAICTMLLIGASLLFRSVVHLQTRDAGFNTRELYSVSVSLPDDRYKTPEQRAVFLNELAARIRAVPGVQGASVTSASPPGASFLIGALQLEGQPEPEAGATSFINYTGVEPGYFRLLGMRLVEGTTFTDTSTKAGQIVVNEGMVRKYWPGQSGLGRRLRTVNNGKGDWLTIVGVVANAFTAGLMQESSQPMIYAPVGLFRSGIVLRTGASLGVMHSMQAIVTSLDAHLPPPQLMSVEDAMSKTISRPRFTMFLLMIFTIVAVALAGIGLYGVLAYTVAQRTREIGIRMALGASRQAVARSVMRRGLVLAGIGAVIGVAAARAGAKLIGSMLYGVGQSDPVAFTSGIVLLVVIALLACIVPTRRAVSVDPLIAMRAD